MQVNDIMTTNVVSVSPDTSVEDIAKTFLERHISGVPVVDDNAHILGIVSEGDLLRRPETENEHQRSWWLRLLSGTQEEAADYIKTHGHSAADVMSRKVITVAPTASIGEVAHTLEKHRIKRVPVVSDGKLIGIASRANLLQGLAAHKTTLSVPTALDDSELREAVLTALKEQNWINHPSLNVVVANSVVELWGLVDSDTERKGIVLAIENVPGVKAVEDHLGSVPPYLMGA